MTKSRNTACEGDNTESGEFATVTATSSATNVGVTNYLMSYVSEVFGDSSLPTATKEKKRYSTASTTERRVPKETETAAETNEVTAFHDLIAGGIAGSASVIVGHPFDTIKVRLQTSSSTNTSSSSSSKSSLSSVSGGFGGTASLFRGMGAPLGCAAIINAIVFSSYGESTRLWDEHYAPDVKSTHEHHDPNEKGVTDHHQDHEPWQKAFVCGSFAGLAQCLVICPMEHVKCRLQIQHGKGSSDHLFKGPVDAANKIVRQHGVQGLYRGWWTTAWREIPAFGLYFASYDYIKERINKSLFTQDPNIGHDDCPAHPHHSHTWLASGIAGGISGSITWAVVYPIDVIKSRVQTAPLNCSREQVKMFHVGQDIVQKYGWRYLFRGFGVTLLRAFPVNGIIFPMYEFALKQISGNENAEV